jgi:hypothetical protein
MASASAENLKRAAEEDAKKKLSGQKIDLLNSRDPKKEGPIGKPLPQPGQMVGPPPRRE